MNRSRKIAVGVVLVGVALLYGLVGFHPASAGTAAPFDDAAPNGSYTSQMSLSTNGDHFVTFDVRNDEPDGQLLLTASFENVTYTTYWHANRSVTRPESTTQTRYEQMLDRSPDDRVIRQDNASRTAVVVDTDEHTPGSGRALLLTVLDYPGYEHSGTTMYEGREVDVYTAQSGWFNTESFEAGRTAYTVESASGVLYVDADTEQLLYSNVTFEFVRAETLGEYLVTKYVRGESPTTAVDVAVDPGATNVTRPEWAPAQSE